LWPSPLWLPSSSLPSPSIALYSTDFFFEIESGRRGIERAAAERVALTVLFIAFPFFWSFLDLRFDCSPWNERKLVRIVIV
jgi:hypothetical protein